MPERRTPNAGGVTPPPLGPQGWGDGPARTNGDAPSVDPAARPGLIPNGLSAELGAQLERLHLRMPQRRGAAPIFSIIWFMIAFAIPILFGTVYFGVIASKQYVSEFHFTVRQPLPDGQPPPSAYNPSDLVGLLGRSNSAAGAADTLDNYTVVDYIRSDQAARDLDKRLNLHSMFAKAGVDPLSRYGGSDKAERLAKFWRRMVWATYDPATGLAAVKVRAFSPADSFAIATNLIDLSDGVVNTIGRRSRADSLRVAQQEVDAAQHRMTEIQDRLLALRTQLGTIDPAKDQEIGNDTLDTNLRDQLTQLERELVYESSQLQNPNAPQIVNTKAEISATQKQLAAIDARFKAAHAGSVPIAQAVGEYEQLDTERLPIEQSLFASLQQLQQASLGADGQRLYLSTYVQPAMPEVSTYPERLQSILILALVSAMVWLIGLLVGKSVMDHVR